MEIKDIKKGDIVTYRSGETNYVNKAYQYKIYYTSKFKNIELGSNYDIMKIQRYVKFLCFYRLVTIYERD